MNININSLKNLFEPDNRSEQDFRLREKLNSSFFEIAELKPDVSVVDLALKLAKVNFQIDESSISPQSVIDQLTGDIISSPLIDKPLTINQISNLYSELLDLVTPNSIEEKAVLTYIFFAKGHFFPDGNGRISRVTSACILELEPTRINSLVSSNLELKEWTNNLADSFTSNHIDRFLQIYQFAKKDENIGEFIRILKGDLPKFLTNLKFSRKQ